MNLNTVTITIFYLEMRLSLSGHFPDDGCFYLLGSSEKSMGQRRIYVFKNQRGAHEYRIGVVQFDLVLSRIYCTPRCHTTGGWEVGICNEYAVGYSPGCAGPTSFDLNVLQIFDQLIIFVRASYIRCFCGSIFSITEYTMIYSIR